MSVIRVGSNSRYADGWDAVFGGAKGGGRAATGRKSPKGAAKSKKPAARSGVGTKAGKQAKKKAGSRRR